ncbi:hypothetical protein ACU635_32210 [[Actinomadura] parvosata]|uniref:hypothetical protein n=1 Tax=[Actinomadura] parvosata TaxID=1955412 RepID=UPI00406C4F22
MDPLAKTFGTTLVATMTTPAWQRARTAAVELWREARPDQAGAVERDLTDARALVLAARNEGDTDTEPALAGSWQLRLQRLLRESPALAPEIQRVLDEVLTPALAPAARPRRTVTMTATARDHGRIYQAGGNQYIIEHGAAGQG